MRHKATQREAQWWGTLLASLTSPNSSDEEKRRARYGMAEHVRRHLEDHVRDGELARRPPMVPGSDDAMVDLLEASRRGKKLSREDARAVNWFQQWRADVLASEQRWLGTVLLLMDTVVVFRELGLADRAQEVEQHLADAWGLDAAVPASRWDRELLGRGLVMDLNLLSPLLRDGRPPPYEQRAVPTRAGLDLMADGLPELPTEADWSDK